MEDEDIFEVLVRTAFEMGMDPDDARDPLFRYLDEVLCGLQEHGFDHNLHTDSEIFRRIESEWQAESA
jgi:hypothetical protein